MVALSFTYHNLCMKSKELKMKGKMLKTLNRVRYWVYNRKKSNRPGSFPIRDGNIPPRELYSLLNRRERSEVCQSAGPSPFERYTL